VLDKGHDFGAFDRALVQFEIDAGETDPGDGREFLPIEVEFEDRRLAFGCPCALASRSLRKAAFIDENNGAALARRPRRDFGPLLLFPLEDFVLFALACLAGGFLRAPLHRAQQPPNVGRAGADTQMLGHHRTHPGQAPKRVVVAMRLRPLGQQLRQMRFAFALERCLPSGLPRLEPRMGSLPRDSQTTSNLRSRQTRRKHLRRFHPSVLPTLAQTRDFFF